MIWAHSNLYRSSCRLVIVSGLKRMSITTLSITAGLWALAAVSINAFAQTGTNDGFELVRDEDNIVVYERWVTFPKSDPPVTAREVKSEFEIRGRVNDALALLQDETQVSKWQHHLTEFDVYPLSDSTWLEYSYRDIPWPVSDQDHLLRYEMQAGAKEGEAFITFETVEDDRLAPVRKDVSRMTLSGSWHLQKIGPDKIKATYRILSMPGNLPRFITDPVIRNNLMTTVRSFIDLLENGYKAQR